MSDASRSERAMKIGVPGLIVVSTFGYFAACLAGYLFHYAPESVATFWPASGVLLGTLLLLDRRRWPIVVLCCLVAGVCASGVVALDVVDLGVGFQTWQLWAGLPNVLEAWVAAEILTRVLPQGVCIRRWRDLIALFAAAVLVAAPLAAAAGAVLISLTSEGGSWFQVWQVWWFADALGLVVVAPAIIGWARRRSRRERDGVPLRSPEAWAMFGALLVVCVYLLGFRPEAPRSFLAYPYLVAPLLLWIALRASPAIVASAIVLLTFVVVLLMDAGRGPFVLMGRSAFSDVLAMQTFLCAASVTTLLLAAALAQHRDLESALKSELAERRALEEHQRMMMNELDHRVKNNLASVLSLITLTEEASNGSAETFSRALAGRVHALARTHEALAASRWKHVDLERIVRSVLDPYISQPSQLTVEGPPVQLDARIGTPLSLALHELANNAFRHGALRSLGGNVDVRWTSAAERLRLTWRERTDRPVDTGAMPRAGLGLVEGMVAYELGGGFEYRFEPDGFGCTLEVPLVEAPAGDAARPLT